MQREVITSSAWRVSDTSWQFFLGTSFSSCELWLRGEFCVEAKGPIFYLFFFFSFPQCKAATSVRGEFRRRGIFHYDSGRRAFPSSKPITLSEKLLDGVNGGGEAKEIWFQRSMWVLLACFHAPIELHCVVIGPWPTMITTARVHLATVEWKHGIVTLKMSFRLKSEWPICRVVLTSNSSPHVKTLPPLTAYHVVAIAHMFTAGKRGCAHLLVNYTPQGTCPLTVSKHNKRSSPTALNLPTAACFLRQTRVVLKARRQLASAC